MGCQRPARLALVDLDRSRVVESVALGGDRREAVYAVCVVPEGFAPPPAVLGFAGGRSAAKTT